MKKTTYCDTLKIGYNQWFRARNSQVLLMVVATIGNNQYLLVWQNMAEKWPLGQAQRRAEFIQTRG
jgi:hypothetical protein